MVLPLYIFSSQSWSESISSSGVATRFDKPGVFACEPDGADYNTAPDLLIYMTAIVTHLPKALNNAATDKFGEKENQQISSRAFNAKLAVTSPGGSVYPRHIDNPRGLTAGDTRKLTCILYLNPLYDNLVDGGELRLFLPQSETVDVPPEGGRVVLFWSDEIPHEVLPTAVGKEGEEEHDRYAVTVWLPTEDGGRIHSAESPFKSLRDEVF